MKLNRRQKLCGVALLIVVIGLLIFRVVPKHPTPGYAVASQLALQNEFSSNSTIRFPNLDDWPMEDTNYSVILKSRFWYDKVGYSISARLNPEDKITSLTISAQLISSFTWDDYLVPNATCGDIPIEVEVYPDLISVSFDLAGVRYSVVSTYVERVSVNDLIALAATIMS